MGMVLVGAAALVAAAGVLILIVQQAGKGPSEEEIFRRFAALAGFTITERHAHEGSGLAADETRGMIAVQGRGRDRPAVLAARDLAAWRYLPKDGIFEMSLKSHRHAEPFIVTFRKSATADEWLKIFRKMADERG